MIYLLFLFIYLSIYLLFSKKGYLPQHSISTVQQYNQGTIWKTLKYSRWSFLGK